MTAIVLLGPQRFARTLGAAVQAIGVTGKIAVVTAGWQERESEDDELAAHLAGRTVNLRLYERGEELFAADPELFAAHRARQDELRQLQELYRLRLALAKEAARQLMAREGPPELLEPERRDAIAAIRDLDEHHLERVREARRQFETRCLPFERPAVRQHLAALERELAGCEAVAIAGGHVAVLLNRLRLFGGERWLRGRPLLAWSAGAMAICERVVLFHDSPPQGAGDAEVLDEGLGLCLGLVPLPHARRRLRLNDPFRVGLFCRRFAPAAVVAFDDGAWLLWSGHALRATPGARQFTPEGALVEMGEEAS